MQQIYFKRLKIKKLFIIIWLLAFSLESYSQESDNVSIIGTGDIMLGSNHPSDAKLPPNDGKDLLTNVKTILKSADVTFGNLEGCFLNSGGTQKSCKSGCYYFRMPDRYVERLLDAGFDVINIANNHMGDFGQQGRTNTVKVLKAAGLAFAGLKDICETSEFEINGVKYGFCGFAPNNGTVKINDLDYAKKIVSALNKTCDIVIVSFHGGAEGPANNRVTKKTETFYGENRGNVHEFAHTVIDAGADVVFGHGPHVVRAAELYKDRFIIYSMGNFCTSGDFNINGISGYAPIVKIYTDKTGVFQKGQIFSALQKDKTGPVLDEKNSAAKEIKRLTELDFPQSKLNISDDGRIERKDKLTGNRDNHTPVNKIDAKVTPPLESLYSTSANRQKSKIYPIKSLDVKLVSLSTKSLTESMSSTKKHGTHSFAETIIDYSKNYLGLPYRRGSQGPKSFDCSGFTSFVFKNFGYNLSSGCVTQVNQGTKIDKEKLKTGDLIFFKGRDAKSSRVGHVGIVVSNDGGNITFIHACNRGVIIEDLNGSAYYKPRYVTGLRILEENANS
ncbi:MAG: CapA family protein [Prevotellaceae bacterium]|jgi:cell wall-associated NlpC family hydrolase|nr:CapA family protein [Prevotellaceae bacterium]